MPYRPLTGDSHRSYRRSLNVMLTSVCSYEAGIGLALPPSQDTYWYDPGLMTNVSAKTNNSTKNSTVYAVGNLKPFFCSGSDSTGGAVSDAIGFSQSGRMHLA